MHLSRCKCQHHKVGWLVKILAGVSALGFWIATLKHGSFFGISEIHFFKEFVVFALISISMHRGCTCCGGGGVNCSVEGMK